MRSNDKPKCPSIYFDLVWSRIEPCLLLFFFSLLTFFSLKDFLKPDKDFLFEGPLAIQKSKKKTEQVYVFLFRDSLLVARALGVTNGFLKRMSGYKFSALQNIKLQKYSLVEHSTVTLYSSKYDQIT
mmetsp:Transcript_7547/g.8270  ORF Transcript_7547/g.8270 Transcript_7547/m.8270 type:complete len:127 (+) Transcript_7547:457-837(+)